MADHQHSEDNMRYQRRSYQRNDQPRAITVKFSGQCACCGATIKTGELATYYPAKRQIAHMGGLDGNSATCTAEIRRRSELIDVDRAYEDQCAEICGR